MTFKIAYNDETGKFWTDASRIRLAQWIVDTLPEVRAAVKRGDFSDVNGAMACQPFDLPIHYHHGTLDALATVANVHTLDTYAVALACMIDGTLGDVTSGSYVSWFWFDGPGADITRCRSAKGILKKLDNA